MFALPNLLPVHSPVEKLAASIRDKQTFSLINGLGKLGVADKVGQVMSE